MIKLVLLSSLLLCFGLSSGCLSVEQTNERSDWDFQPEGQGIKDFDAFKEDLISLSKTNAAPFGDGDGAIRRLIYLMTWKQACVLYRTDKDFPFQVFLLYLIMSKHQFNQGVWTTKDVIDLLGIPDGIWFGMRFPAMDRESVNNQKDVISYLEATGNILQTASLVYTGCGSVSDSMSGYILHFDEKGHYCGMTPAN
ncbi:MAG: hypothetical protein HY811_05470 [Planctomycetes bacterium]|nr:hypothetical protein [Planctomycetota bacterium]